MTRPPVPSPTASIPVWLSLLLVALFCSSIQADFKKSDWEFYKSVPVSSANGYVRLSLDGDVYEHSRLSLSDLRLLDDEQSEVPYGLFEAKESTTEERRHVRVFNQGRVPKAYSTMTLDLGEAVYSNKLVVKTRSQNFKRRTEVSGSSDGRKWLVLRDNAYIFDFSGDQKIQLTTVQYPESHYRYLEVKIWNGSELPLELEGAEVFLVKTETPARILLPHHLLSREEDPKLKATLCLLDLNYRNLPSDLMVLETPEENFSRLVEIQGNNDLKDWQRHLQSEFYRFKTSKYDVEKKGFHFPEARCRYLKVIIYNYDDPPLHLGNIEVRGIAKDIIFRAAPGRQYFLYYGNEHAVAPHYDMAQVKNYLNIESLARVRLSGENRNEEFVSKAPQKPWSERSAVLFWGVLVFLVLALGAYIVQLMKKVKTA